jgi:hypothetical protein
MSQLNYNLFPAVGRAGMVAESRADNMILSKLADGLVPLGLLAAPGANAEVGTSPTAYSTTHAHPGEVKALPAGIVDDPILDSQWIGVPVYDSSRPPMTSLDEYSDKDYVPVMRKGVLWVLTEGAVTQYGDVYVRTAPSGPNVTLGKFSFGAGAGKALFPKGRWLTSLTGAGLAVLELA